MEGQNYPSYADNLAKLLTGNDIRSRKARVYAWQNQHKEEVNDAKYENRHPIKSKQKEYKKKRLEAKLAITVANALREIIREEEEEMQRVEAEKVQFEQSLQKDARKSGIELKIHKAHQKVNKRRKNK